MTLSVSTNDTNFEATQFDADVFEITNIEVGFDRRNECLGLEIETIHGKVTLDLPEAMARDIEVVFRKHNGDEVTA